MRAPAWLAAVSVSLAAIGSGSARADETEKDLAASREAIARFEAYLERYPESSSRAEVLFTLGQLHEEIEIAEAFSPSAGDAEAPSAVPHPRSIRCYEEAVDAHPQFEKREECLYRLGGVLLDAGDGVAAKTRFAQLVLEFPEGSLAGRACLRLGEIAEAQDLPREAAAHYERALSSGVDAHAERLHYRRGWALHKAGDGEPARAELVAGAALEESLGANADAGFLRETLHLLALVHAGGAGLDRVEESVAALRTPAARRSLLADLGLQLEGDARFAESVGFLDRANAADPLHDEAPVIAQAAVRASGRGARAEDLAARCARFDDHFGPGSEWRRARPLRPEDAVRVDAWREENLYAAGVLLYEQAVLDTARPSAGAPAADAALARALDRFPGSAMRHKALFLRGEIARAESRWSDAIARFDAVRPESLDAAHREPLLYARVLAWDGLRSANATRPTDAAASGAGSAAAPAAATPESREAARGQIGAIDDYCAALPEAPRSALLRHKRAELLGHAGEHEAAADAFRVLYDQAPRAGGDRRDLAAQVAAQLVASRKWEDAAEWYRNAGDEERAAAALYERAQEIAAEGRPDEAGLALIALVSRSPKALVSVAARLDIIDLLSRGSRADTLASWAAALPPRARAAGDGTDGAADSLSAALLVAAERSMERTPHAAARLYGEAARLASGDAVAGALLRGGAALDAAGLHREGADLLATALVLMPREPRALPALLFSADLLADSLHDAPAALALLERAAPIGRDARVDHRVAWRRRTAAALDAAGRPDASLDMLDRALDSYAEFAATGTEAGRAPASTAVPRIGPAPEVASASAVDTLLLEREAALCAVAKGDLLTRDLILGGAARSLTKKELAALRTKTDAAAAAYAFAMQRAFRDLTARAGCGAGRVLEGLARTLAVTGLARRDPALVEEAHRVAARADAARGAVAALPADALDEWVCEAAASRKLNRALAARVVVATDSIAGPLPQTPLSEKATSDRILLVAALAEVLSASSAATFAAAEVRAAADAALREGAFREEMAQLLLRAPRPTGLDGAAVRVYDAAARAKAGEFIDRAALCYREALARIDDNSGAPVDPEIDAARSALRSRLDRIASSPWPPAMPPDETTSHSGGDARSALDAIPSDGSETNAASPVAKVTGGPEPRRKER